MRTFLLLTITVFLVGCSKATPAPPVEKLDQVALFDVQALWGGHNLWIKADGKAIGSFITPSGGKTKDAGGFRELRYEMVLSPEQRATLLGLVNKHHFFSVETKNRHGVPDEARPMIFIKSGSRTHSVAKWAGDTHEHFDPIYRFLKTPSNR